MDARNLKDLKNRGEFIVIYGPNNIGKSTQIKLLAQDMIENKTDLLVIKYPIYNLEPTGPKLNSILRSETKKEKTIVREEDLQKIFAQNRRDFQDQLIKLLNSGITVLAEDYTGTGIAWGMTRGVSLKKLEKYNKGLINPDLAILLDGERFEEAKETIHRNEGADSDKWEEVRQIDLFFSNNTWDRNRQIHLQLAKRYNWETVNADDSIEEVHKNIKRKISKISK